MEYKSDPCVGEDDRNFADIDRMLMVKYIQNIFKE
jgi:hypothetical protein